ncbi:MAG: ribosomal protein S18-alanine N-acetyltransferase [Eubacterium sp.]|nr:ribosomal protein S18-alanine N-acetyltransferase [Eubacterium sp.]
MKQLIIRAANKDDAESLAEIEKACFTTPWSMEALRQDLIGNENAIYIVVQGDEGELLGYLSVWCVADEGQIMTVAVMPEHRRKHVASVLMHAMLKVTEERGVKSHTLELRKSNEAALGLYEKFGFQVAGIRPGYYEDDGEDALIMWRIGDPSKPGKES